MLKLAVTVCSLLVPGCIASTRAFGLVPTFQGPMNGITPKTSAAASMISAAEIDQSRV